ncbi:nucleoporin Nup186/Nup192/Nup205 [Bombardia bombarda]|uniref:Nucleoporin Nup186/Nup192/Nup205 n=1 Tax=Bombardia bombarda TaxID=252184 RepID=A0AA39WTU7_9PEZI|nr:nucleoporin Nup186/Nup192/Nup205 [Bombardia bombarda]
MAELRPLEALRALHAELLAVSEHRYEDLQTLEQLIELNKGAFSKFLAKLSRNPTSRTALSSKKITINGEDFQVNDDFLINSLQLAEDLDLDELEAARVLLDANAEDDQEEAYGRPLWQCGLIRFHQERKYLVDCMRLCIEIASDDADESIQDAFGAMVEENIYKVVPPGNPDGGTERFVPKCLGAMEHIKSWLRSMAERMAARNLVQQSNIARPSEQQELYDFSRLSLVQQHEGLAVILCSAIEKRHAVTNDFRYFFELLRTADKYDHLLAHLFPVLGTYITVFGSSQWGGDIGRTRLLNRFICEERDTRPWLIPSLGAAVQAWWIAEYSGWYLDDTPGLEEQGVNLDKEDEDRSKQFMDALKDGAFEFILSVAADCKAQDWQDPTRLGMRQWLQRKSPPLVPEPFPFTDFFRRSLMMHLEVLVDAAISNIPDVLRKLRTEEDEQRQLSQTHEQDLDLERFLIIIAYAYEGRPEAAMSFWEDSDSNLAGFLHWASRRASTPLVSAFCEMLQSLSDNEWCATACHDFLLDEGHHSSGKMKRSHSLTWNQIFKELEFFTAKLRERPSPAQSHLYRLGKPSNDQAETEPESALMLECYLRLIAKLTTESEVARRTLLYDENLNLVRTLLHLAASGIIPARLKASAFYVLKALLSRKTEPESIAMWEMTDQYISGMYAVQPISHRGGLSPQNLTPEQLAEATLNEISDGYEEPIAFIQYLTALVTPAEGPRQLNDTLSFSEELGINSRGVLGIDIYVDYVFDRVFSQKSTEISDPAQLILLRLSCLDFAMTCLATFNEDLIILGNETNIAIDSAISTKDLATYVRLHPFARVMDWMFNDKVVDALISTIHQDASSLSNAAPDSPLVLSILRAVEVILKVLELQDTYLHLVRPLKLHGRQPKRMAANAAYASFEDGIMNHLALVVDLGRYCGIRQPPLTLACLKLLEKISTSSKIISAWSPDSGLHGHRNKAIVQLEKNGEGEAIAASLSAEIVDTLDPVLEAEGQNYVIKLFVLDFLYECLKATPDQPTIAHLLLGFRCELNTVTVESRGRFDLQKSLFHSLLNIFIGTSVFQEELGVRGYLVALKYRIMRIFQILWSSPLSARWVMEELRETNFVFHILLQEVKLQPALRWDGLETGNPEFLLTNSAVSYVDFLATRAMAFEYIGKELCSVSQNRIPSVKRQIFDALNGQITGDSNEPITVPTIIDFFDFLTLDGQWDIPAPHFEYYKGLDLSACTEQDPVSGLQYNTHKVQEVLWLKRSEQKNAGGLIDPRELSAIEREEVLLQEYVVYTNRYRRFGACRLKLLRAWTNLILVMFEANDLRGTPRMAFLLQALQAILPSLEAASALSATEAYELARVAKVLLFKIDFDDDTTPAPGVDKDSLTVGNLISDKLFQLFQVCLSSISKWAGSAELRALYYSICYRYLTGVVDKSSSSSDTAHSSRGCGLATSRYKTLKTIQASGERLLNVICDDAYGSDPGCQTAAMILLGALVHIGHADDDAHVVETLSRLNFIGVLVDSLKTTLSEWLGSIVGGNNLAAEQYVGAKLALLLQLCQTRAGAKFVLQANLFRALELSGVFAADPELEIDARNTRALEKHYGLLVSLARIVGAAVLARGSHNVVQGRRFLTQNRTLVVHTLKRSAGIGTVGNGGGGGGGGGGGWYGGSLGGSSRFGATGGGGGGGDDSEAQLALEERIEELAEAFMLLITATGFLEFEAEQIPSEKPRMTSTTLFH